MRRKSDRGASKKEKSPEKKLEKSKPTRTRRRKQSTSSENDSVDEVTEISEQSQTESANIKTASPSKNVTEETPDQVWQVKTAESSGDSGEIQKLKICLKRPPSTPEHGEKSPRNKRKSRATSSSETPGSEGSDEKKKRHKSKRLNRESKDESDKSDTQLDVSSKEDLTELNAKGLKMGFDESKNLNESDEAPKTVSSKPSKYSDEGASISPKVDESNKKNNVCVVPAPDSSHLSQKEQILIRQKNCEKHDKHETGEICEDVSPKKLESLNKKALSKGEEVPSKDKINYDKNDFSNKKEILEKDVSDSRQEKEFQEDITGNKVSKEEKSNESRTVETKSFTEHNVDSTCEKVVESVGSDLKMLTESLRKSKSEEEQTEKSESQTYDGENRNLSRENSQNDPVPFVVSRKRKWGSKANRSNSTKSLTISTDVLKDIIPDVKPAEFEEVMQKKHHKKVDRTERVERPQLPKIVIDNREQVEQHKKEATASTNKIDNDVNLGHHRKISIVKENDVITRPPSPPKNKQSCILYITNLVRPFTLPQLKNLLQRTGKIVEDGFWIDNIKSRCYVKYETEDQAVETRHALHGVTWPVSNPKTLHVDFSTQDSLDKAKNNEDVENQKVSTIPGTVEDWLREQDLKRERGEPDKPWERKPVMREWDVGKNEKNKDIDHYKKEDRNMEKRKHYTHERSPEPAKKFKKKEEEAPAKLLDDLFRKTKTTPCIYWLPLSAETISVKEQQRRQHMAEYERRMQEMRRHRRPPH